MASFVSLYLNIYHVLSKLPVVYAHLLPKTVQHKRVRDDCVLFTTASPRYSTQVGIREINTQRQRAVDISNSEHSRVRLKYLHVALEPGNF